MAGFGVLYALVLVIQSNVGPIAWVDLFFLTLVFGAAAPSITRRLIEEFVRRPAPGQSRPPELEELTDREVEVLQLVAKGLSNAEIGAALFVSEATVKTRVTWILAKLRLRDRVQAVVLAYESGVVQAGGTRPGTEGRVRAGSRA